MERLWHTETKQKSRRLGSLRRSLSHTWNTTKKLVRRYTRLNDLPVLRKYMTSDPHRPRLPPELIDQVIGYLHDDTNALLSLSLVCHALVPSARYHLFTRLKITKYNSRRISALFTQGAPQLASYVHELTLEAGDERLSDQVFRELRGILDGKAPRTLLRQFFQHIAPRTLNVERLVLQGIPLEKSLVGMLALCFPKLNTLSLFDCWFRCNADLDRLVRDHPGIESLRVGRVCSIYGSASSEPTDTIGSKFDLRQLKITEAFSPAPLTLMPWLLGHCSSEHFIYVFYRLGQFPKLNAAISEMKSLTHLHLIFYHWRSDEMLEAPNNPSLLSLMPRHPPMITIMTLDGKLYMLDVVVAMLAQLDPGSFVHLHTLNVWVHLEEEGVRKVKAVIWASADQTLSVLLSLRVVNFFNSCQDTTHVHSGSEAIETRLPILNARKLLRFRDLEAPF